MIVGNLLQTEDFGKTLREISLETKRAIARRFLRSSTSAGGVLPAQHRFKPMNFPLAGMRRVQVGSFVLLYSIDEQRRTVVLEDYDYRRE